MAKNHTAELPKGFTAISAGGDSWKPNKPGDSIRGIKVGTKTVHFDEEKKGKKVVREARDVIIHVIKTDKGEVGIWQSAGLRALEEVKKGKAVFVRFDGMGRAKPGQSAPRLFTVAVK